MPSSDSWRPLAVGGTLFLSVLLLVLGCSDDPILGPGEGPSDDGGGSYSTIERLAPSDSSAAPNTGPSVRRALNPERF